VLRTTIVCRLVAASAPRSRKRVSSVITVSAPFFLSAMSTMRR